jgi:DNA replication protein DnaC
MAMSRTNAILVTEKWKEEEQKKQMKELYQKLCSELSVLENDFISRKNEFENDEKRKLELSENRQIEIERLELLRQELVKEHGKVKEQGNFVKMAQLGNDSTSKLLLMIAGGYIDHKLGTGPTLIHNSNKIKELDQRLKKLNEEEARYGMEVYFRKDEPDFFSEMKERIEKKRKEIMVLKQKIDQPIVSKSLMDLKDAAGFVSAKSLKYANFSERVRLDGAMGEFLGDLEMDKLAITLLGKPGSGKTYFTFDLMRAFSKLDFTIAYFSLEEGINDLTRTKLEKYGLMEKENIMLIDRGNIEDIKKAASQFKVIIIDSWGKLNAPTDEFDMLRNQFPKTIFISIFQQTTSGAMRGGTKAAFDAGINIETYKEGEERIATCTKNRYGMAGLKYGINEGRLL